MDSPLCHLYLNKRPLDLCQGYSSTLSTGSITAKEAAQGVGEESLHVYIMQKQNHQKCVCFVSGLDGFSFLSVPLSPPSDGLRQSPFHHI